MFYNYDRDNAAWMKIAYYYLTTKSTPRKLCDIYPFETIRTILTCTVVKSAFTNIKFRNSSEHEVSEVKEDAYSGQVSTVDCLSETYEEAVSRVLNNSYLEDLPSASQGKTLYNLDVLITRHNVFEGDSEAMLGFVIAVLIHELGHVFVRLSLTTAAEYIEYDSFCGSINEEKYFNHEKGYFHEI